MSDEPTSSPPDPHGWLNNKRLIQHIKHLLVQTGLPLEQRVARTCRSFEGWGSTGIDSVWWGSDRFLYHDPATGALREIDQRAFGRAMVVPGEWADWQTVALDATTDEQDQVVGVAGEIFIECKHREGVAYFGFPDVPGHGWPPGPPLLSELAGTSVMGEVETVAPKWFTEAPPCTIGMLENMHHALNSPNEKIAGGQQPRKGDEALIYKASASLYDGIATIIDPVLEPRIDSQIQALGLLDAYRADLAQQLLPNEPWDYTCRWVQRHVPLATCVAFNAAYDDWDTGPSVTAVLPILCVDAPLYTVEVHPDGSIGTLTPTDVLWTSVRLASWPAIAGTQVVNASRAAVVLVVTADALEPVLHEAARWFQAIYRELASASPIASIRLPLEMRFLQSVRALQAGATA